MGFLLRVALLDGVFQVFSARSIGRGRIGDPLGELLGREDSIKARVLVDFLEDVFVDRMNVSGLRFFALAFRALGIARRRAGLS